MVAILRFSDCTAVVGLLRRHGGDGGATAVLVRYHGGHGGDTAVMAVTRRSWRCRGDPTADWAKPAEVLNMIKVSVVPPRRSAVLTRCYGDQ